MEKLRSTEQRNETTLGAATLLAISRFEDPVPVMDALEERGITYLPLPIEGSSETVLHVDTARFHGLAEILDSIDEIRSIAQEAS